jgi:hypothetical protein
MDVAAPTPLPAQPSASPGVPPTPADGVLRALDPRWVPAERVTWWITIAIAGGASLPVLVLAAIFGWFPAWLLAAAALLWLTLVAGLAWLSVRHPLWTYARTRYAVSRQGIEIHRGLLWRSVINVPRSRVQHTDVHQGPIMRRFGISSLVIHTAGTENASVQLAGLSRENAMVIRDHLISGGGADAV